MAGKTIQDVLEDAIDMDEKSTPSDRLYNTGAVVSSLLAFFLHVLFLIVFLISRQAGLLTFQYVFYPMLAFTIASIYLSYAQVLRNRYLSSTLSALIATVNLVAIIVNIILQATLIGGVYIVPFCYF